MSTGLANGPLESFGLLDLEGFGLEEAFPNAYSIAHDGYGNYWILDLLPVPGPWGPVFYACHDPPVIACQSPSIEAFVAEMIALWQPGPRSAIDRMHEDDVNRIWRDHPGLLAPGDAARADDPVLAAFAATLTSNAWIADLRAGRPGQGFAWGRFGPRTEIRRAGHERLWAVVPPAPKPGWLRRLFDLSCAEYDRLNLDKEDSVAELTASFERGLDGLSENETRQQLVRIERAASELTKSGKLYGHLYDDLLKLKYLHQRYTNYLRWLRAG